MPQFPGRAGSKSEVASALSPLMECKAAVPGNALCNICNGAGLWPCANLLAKQRAKRTVLSDLFLCPSSSLLGDCSLPKLDEEVDC